MGGKEYILYGAVTPKPSRTLHFNLCPESDQLIKILTQLQKIVAHNIFIVIFALSKHYNSVMEKITKKEEEVMNLFWEHGPMFVRDLVELYPDPKPHFNTVSTMVRALESKGYVDHKSFGPTYQYFAAVSRDEFGKQTLRGIIGKYFQNSYRSAVSALVSEEDISVDELKELISQIEKQ